jgi:hypothetical protein
LWLTVDRGPFMVALLIAFAVKAGSESEREVRDEERPLLESADETPPSSPSVGE